MSSDNEIIGEFMGYVVPSDYSNSWNHIMEVGDKMENLIIDGNWGEFEQFFSDEMHSFDRFRQACYDRNKMNAVKSIIMFIVSLEHQDPKTLKKAKEYGN